MYISSFHIDGFSIFANVDLRGLTPGISIFFGRNEAGKSTCLEFLRVMLTGYPDNPAILRRFAPRAGGKAGGSISLICDNASGPAREITIFRSPDSCTVLDASGSPLDPGALEAIFFGLTPELYRNVFGFGLSELENLRSLDEEGMRNALYGASFGAGLRSPTEVMASLGQEMEKLHASRSDCGSMREWAIRLEELRGRIAAARGRRGAYDGLCLERKEVEKALEESRARSGELIQERRRLERRLGAWGQWNEWRLARARLERIPESAKDFPAEGRERMERLRAQCEECEERLAERKERLEQLRAQRDSCVVNEALLGLMPELRRLSERKSGYRQALGQIKILGEAKARAEKDLAAGLALLGNGWDCDRIRATDRSIFAREDLSARGRDLEGAYLSLRAAMDFLDNANREAESASASVDAATQALEALPLPEAALSDRERDELRQNIARLEESRKQAPVRDRALDMAKAAFARALHQARLEITDIGGDGGLKARDALDKILASHKEAMEVAREMGERLKSASEGMDAVARAEEGAEGIKKKIEALRATRRDGSAQSRDALDRKAAALRSLRTLSTNISAEKERLQDLDARIAAEAGTQPSRNWLLLGVGALFLLAGAVIVGARFFFGMGELPLSPGFSLQLNLWGAYVALACGVVLLAFGLPGHGPEKKRKRQALAQLRSRREASSLHLAELEEKAGTLGEEAGVRNLDEYTLDATEMKLDREREHFFHEERSRQEIKGLKNDLALASDNIASLRSRAQELEGEVQKCRRKWHDFMRGLRVAAVPSPESAESIFARAEAARLAYDNVANATKEADALWEDLHLLEERIASLPAVAQRIEDAEEPLSLEGAARLALDSCREADLLREKRERAEAELERAGKELERVRSRQEDASAGLDKAKDLLEKSRGAWVECLDSLGLDSSLEPDTARDALQRMDDCLATESELARCVSELEICQAELDSMAIPLGGIFGDLSRPLLLDGAKEADWLASLDEIMADAEKNLAIRDERERMENVIAEEEAGLGRDEARLARGRASEADLLRQAGTDDRDEFARLAGQYSEFRELSRNVELLESSLTIAAGGEPLESFLASFDEDEKESQEARLGRIEEELESRRQEEQRRVNAIAALASEIQTMGRDEDLARLRQEEMMLLENMRLQARSWSVLALARALLGKARDTFEAERQPAVLKSASGFFSRMTAGRWRGIGASLEEKDSLRILPPEGSPTTPEMLSRGAAEQAYLSLRLSYIRDHAAHGTPLPVIMDEVLVNFDPWRAALAAEALADLARGAGNGAQQIFFFTCQPHMVDIIKKTSPGASLFLVENGSIEPVESI